MAVSDKMVEGMTPEEAWKSFVGDITPEAFLNRMDNEIEDGEFVDRAEAFLDFSGQKMSDRKKAWMLAKLLQYHAEHAPIMPFKSWRS